MQQRVPVLCLIVSATLAAFGCQSPSESPPEVEASGAPSGEESVAVPSNDAAGEAEGQAAVAAPPSQPASQPVDVAAEAAAWLRVEESDLNAAQRSALAAARQARATLGGTLMRTVMEAAESGLPAAVEVCADAAPRITAEAATPGLRIGRTSHRLRNPENVPPVWAASHVNAARPEAALFAGPEGQVGELVPIATAAPCVGCHGARDSLTPALRDALASRYPEDAAVDFAEGDLRGFFWFVVEN